MNLALTGVVADLPVRTGDAVEAADWLPLPVGQSGARRAALTAH